MRKFVFVLLLCLWILPAQAQEHLPRLKELAKFFPAGSHAFVAFRMDEGLFDTLDAYYNSASEMMGVSGMSFRQYVDAMFVYAGSNARIDDVLGALGDYGAVGVDFNLLPRAIFAVEDRAVAEAFVEKMAHNSVEKLTTDEFTFYTMAEVPEGTPRLSIAINDTMLILIGEPPADDNFLTQVMFEYEGEEYGIYKVPMPDGTVRELALFKMGRRESDFIDPANPAAEPMLWEGRWRTLEPVSRIRPVDMVAMFSGDTLADYILFTNTMAELPLPEYQFTGYIDLPAIMRNPDMGLMGLNASGYTGQLAFGMTNLDETTIVLDTAQSQGAFFQPDGTFPQQIDPTFARFIPRDVSSAIHATDLSSVIHNGMFTMRALTPGQPDPSVQVIALFTMLGFDLEEDILSWTTGDYALFAYVDTFDLMDQYLGGQSVTVSAGEGGNAQLGILIEATDSTKAAALVEKLTTALNAMLGNTPNITLGTDQLAGVDVTTITIAGSQPGQPSLSIEMTYALGATDEVVFLMPSVWAEGLLSGDAPSLLDNPAYQQALPYTLPDATVLVYGDGEGVILGTAVPTIAVLALIGPAVGDIFENIENELESSALPASSTRQAMVQSDPGIRQQIDLLRQAVNSLRSATISAQITELGVTRLRFVQTVNLANQ